MKNEFKRDEINNTKEQREEKEKKILGLKSVEKETLSAKGMIHLAKRDEK